MSQMQFNPEMVYQLVSSNPNLRQLVEQTAYVNNMNQQVQQMRPMVQATNGFNNNMQQPVQWGQQPMQQAQPLQQAQVQAPVAQQDMLVQPLTQIKPQEDAQMQNTNPILQSLGIPNVGQLLGQVQEIISRFDNNFKVVNDNIKSLFDEVESLNKKLDVKMENLNIEPSKTSISLEESDSNGDNKSKKRVIDEPK